MREISEKISGISEWKAEISWISESESRDFWDFCQ